MRVVHTVPMALAAALAAWEASAQTETPQPRTHRQQPSQRTPPSGQTPAAPPVIVKREALTGAVAVKVARDRMNSGDCAGALDAFDEAIEERRTDPTLYRDRGSCHDKLGHPYPAIEDYRAYLTMAPDASDADGIRTRLGQLRDLVAGRALAGGTQASSAPHVAGATPASSEPLASSGRKASAASEPSGEAQPSGERQPSDEPQPSAGPQPSSADDDIPPKENALAGIDDEDTTEGPAKAEKPSAKVEDEDRPASSLRADRGFALAPFLGARKWFRDDRSFGDGETWAECIGGELRYSMGARAALLLEAGYERFDTTNVDVETASGLTTLLELELRFPFSARYDNQLLLAPGIGYEYLSYSPGADSSSSPYSEGAATGRLRVTYRHMLADAVAFDVSLEGGYAQFFHMSDGAADAHASSAGFAGLNVAFLWGL